jgi:hypothetical protein
MIDPTYLGPDTQAAGTNAAPPLERREIAAEVLELGEALFDVVLDVAAARQQTDQHTPADLDEVRAAANQFFTALRLLLGLEPSEDAAVPAPNATLPTRLRAVTEEPHG